ncbi:hypothetical protein GYMLUDRAFT_50062 [Collybiopsis luxurians FD-317 M1]|uniref:Uncharacterized protein n=1 Tax=Collybiopsis luxurians FD-317 M1 TaxID=944289 RepID=A0A0D0APC7_9AGAR|nr:hypothetical protein GYMLUDRAFT_50062 [Collybiopsis luxurians FD-317 M1]
MMSGMNNWIIAFAVFTLITAMRYAYSRWFTFRNLYHTVTEVDQLLQKYENEPVSKSTLSFEDCRRHREHLIRTHALIGNCFLEYETGKLCWIEYLSLIRTLRRLRAIFSCYRRTRELQREIELSMYRRSIERDLD